MADSLLWSAAVTSDGLVSDYAPATGLASAAPPSAYPLPHLSPTDTTFANNNGATDSNKAEKRERRAMQAAQRMQHHAFIVQQLESLMNFNGAVAATDNANKTAQGEEGEEGGAEREEVGDHQAAVAAQIASTYIENEADKRIVLARIFQLLLVKEHQHLLYRYLITLKEEEEGLVYRILNPNHARSRQQAAEEVALQNSKDAAENNKKKKKKNRFLAEFNETQAEIERKRRKRQKQQKRKEEKLQRKRHQMMDGSHSGASSWDDDDDDDDGNKYDSASLSSFNTASQASRNRRSKQSTRKTIKKREGRSPSIRSSSFPSSFTSSDNSDEDEEEEEEESEFNSNSSSGSDFDSVATTAADSDVEQQASFSASGSRSPSPSSARSGRRRKSVDDANLFLTRKQSQSSFSSPAKGKGGEKGWGKLSLSRAANLVKSANTFNKIRMNLQPIVDLIQHYDRSVLSKHIQKSNIISLISPRLVIQLLYVIDPITQRRVTTARVAVDFLVEEREALIDEIEDLSESREEEKKAFLRARVSREAQRNIRRQGIMLGGGNNNNNNYNNAAGSNHFPLLSSSSSAGKAGGGGDPMDASFSGSKNLNASINNATLSTVEDEYQLAMAQIDYEEEEAEALFEEEAALLKLQLSEVVSRLDEARRKLKQVEDDIAAVVALDLANVFKARQEQKEKAAAGGGSGGGVGGLLANNGNNDNSKEGGGTLVVAGDDQKGEGEAMKTTVGNENGKTGETSTQPTTEQQKGGTNATPPPSSANATAATTTTTAALRKATTPPPTSTRYEQTQQLIQSAAMNAQNALVERKKAALSAFTRHQDDLVVSASHFQNEVFQYRPLLSAAYDMVARFFYNLSLVDEQLKFLEDEEEPAARRHISRMQTELVQDIYSATVRKALLEFQLRERHRSERAMADRVEVNLRSSESARQHEITMAGLREAVMRDQKDEVLKQKANATIEYALSKAEAYLANDGPNELAQLRDYAKSKPRDALRKASVRLQEEVVVPFINRTVPSREDTLNALEVKIASIGAALGALAATKRKPIGEGTQVGAPAARAAVATPPSAPVVATPVTAAGVAYPPLWVLADRLSAFYRLRTFYWQRSTRHLQHRLVHTIRRRLLFEIEHDQEGEGAGGGHGGGGSAVVSYGYGERQQKMVTARQRLEHFEEFVQKTLSASILPQSSASLSSLLSSPSSSPPPPPRPLSLVELYLPSLLSAAAIKKGGGREGGDHNDRQTVWMDQISSCGDKKEKGGNDNEASSPPPNPSFSELFERLFEIPLAAAQQLQSGEMLGVLLLTAKGGTVSANTNTKTNTFSGERGGSCEAAGDGNAASFLGRFFFETFRGEIEYFCQLEYNDDDDDKTSSSTSSSSSLDALLVSKLEAAERDALWFHLGYPPQERGGGGQNKGGGGGQSTSTSLLSSSSNMLQAYKASCAVMMGSSSSPSSAAAAAVSSIGGGNKTIKECAECVQGAFSTDPSFYFPPSSSSSSSSSSQPVAFCRVFMQNQCRVFIQHMFITLLRIVSPIVARRVEKTLASQQQQQENGGGGALFASSSAAAAADAIVVPSAIVIAAVQWLADRATSLLPPSASSSSSSSSMTSLFDANAIRRFLLDNFTAASSSSAISNSKHSSSLSSSAPFTIETFTEMIWRCLEQVINAHRGGGGNGGGHPHSHSSSFPSRVHSPTPPRHLTTPLYVVYRLLRHVLIADWHRDLLPWLWGVLRINNNDSGSRGAINNTTDSSSGGGAAIVKRVGGGTQVDVSAIATASNRSFVAATMPLVLRRSEVALTDHLLSRMAMLKASGGGGNGHDDSLLPYPLPLLFRPILRAMVSTSIQTTLSTGKTIQGGGTGGGAHQQLGDYVELFLDIVAAEYATAPSATYTNDINTSASTNTNTTARCAFEDDAAAYRFQTALSSALLRWERSGMFGMEMMTLTTEHDTYSAALLSSSSSHSSPPSSLLPLIAHFCCAPFPPHLLLPTSLPYGNTRAAASSSASASLPSTTTTTIPVAPIGEVAYYFQALFPRMRRRSSFESGGGKRVEAEEGSNIPTHVIVEELLTAIGAVFAAATTPNNGGGGGGVNNQLVTAAAMSEANADLATLLSSAVSDVVKMAVVSSVGVGVGANTTSSTPEALAKALLTAFTSVASAASTMTVSNICSRLLLCLSSSATTPSTMPHPSSPPPQQQDVFTSPSDFASYTVSTLPISLPMAVACCLLWAEEKDGGGGSDACGNNSNNQRGSRDSVWVFPYSRTDVVRAFVTGGGK